jgi:hypothetical protein
MSCPRPDLPGFRGDFSWNQSPRSELASRGKKGMFFRESIADRLSPAPRSDSAGLFLRPSWAVGGAYWRASLEAGAYRRVLLELQ